MAITFLGYLDTPEEHISGKRRCLYGCDSTGDIASLPTTAGLTIPGGKSAVPAPFSMAIVKGGNAQVLNSAGSWGAL